MHEVQANGEIHEEQGLLQGLQFFSTKYPLQVVVQVVFVLADSELQ